MGSCCGKPPAEPINPAQSARAAQPIDEHEDTGEEDEPLPEEVQAKKLGREAFEKRTGDWDQGNVIGEGPTGKVYRAGSLHGRPIVAKRLTSNSQAKEDFKEEVSLVEGLKHRHVVRLLAYCATAGHRALAFELAHLGSLDALLQASPPALLTWQQRVRILHGAAQGLEYLHRSKGAEGGLVHKRIKSTNVLVFRGYVGKIADYKLQSPDEDSIMMGSSLPLGNFAYDAPETFQCELSQRSDVYSFGIVMLETLCGRKAMVQQQTIKAWVVSKTDKSPDKVREVADPKIVNEVPDTPLRDLFQLAIQCIDETASKRPVMKTVVRSLEAISQQK